MNRRGMKYSDLSAILSRKTIAKMKRDECVSLATIYKICMFLECGIDDVFEFDYDAGGGLFE